jgi:hypothetical protein
MEEGSVRAESFVHGWTKKGKQELRQEAVILAKQSNLASQEGEQMGTGSATMAMKKATPE